MLGGLLATSWPWPLGSPRSGLAAVSQGFHQSCVYFCECWGRQRPFIGFHFSNQIPLCAQLFKMVFLSTERTLNGHVSICRPPQPFWCHFQKCVYCVECFLYISIVSFSNGVFKRAFEMWWYKESLCKEELFNKVHFLLHFSVNECSNAVFYF